MNDETGVHLVREGQPHVAPGWYFWDETGCDRYGPFVSKEECEQALDGYCRDILGI